MRHERPLTDPRRTVGRGTINPAMLEDLKEKVWEANLDLVKHGLVILTFGNASGFDRASGLMAIKPSGLSVRIAPARGHGPHRPGRRDGRRPAPSLLRHADAPGPLSRFPGNRRHLHAHSPAATAFAQAAREIPCLGTTHADHFNGPVPSPASCARRRSVGDYEKNTGTVIVERYAAIDPLEIPAVLVAGHGRFYPGPAGRRRPSQRPGPGNHGPASP